MRADTANWIASAEYDLTTGQHMLATGRYLYVVFCCHIALEKMLKAHVTEVTQTIPPKTHDLGRLLKLAGLQLPTDYFNFVNMLDNTSLPARYPTDLASALKNYPEPVARQYLEATTEILQWLKQHPSLPT